MLNLDSDLASLAYGICLFDDEMKQRRNMKMVLYEMVLLYCTFPLCAASKRTRRLLLDDL